MKAHRNEHPVITQEEEVRRCRARVPVSGFSRSDSHIGLTLSGPCWCTWLGGALGALGALLGGAVLIDWLVLADVVIRPDSYGAGGSAKADEPTAAAPSELSIFSDDATL